MPQGTELTEALRTGPFHTALRAAVAARGLALHRIRHRLAERGVQIGVTSLSYWQRGIRRPEREESLRAVQALEEVLEIPPASLTRLLTPPDLPGRRPARPYRTLDDQVAAMRALLVELGSPDDGGLHTVMLIDRVSIGTRRDMYSVDSQHLVGAHRDGVDRYVIIHHGDPGCDVDRIRVRATHNCRLGRVRRHQESGTVAAEFLFDGRLRVGETALLGYGFEDGSEAESLEYLRRFPFGGRQYVLEVAFTGETRPVRCRSFTQSSASAPRQTLSELVLNGRGTTHIVAEAAEPGLLGIDWTWA
ncbi:hypothetical protein [Streptomyces sp. NPDC059398]|uniref:hypothetical protein n=1 Tax=Streptomyces sp. NPDC059398 TaxID=3346820 RepID=UPI0036A671F3